MKIQMHEKGLWFIADERSQLVDELNAAITEQLSELSRKQADFLRASVKAFGEKFIEDVKTGDIVLGGKRRC